MFLKPEFKKKKMESIMGWGKKNTPKNQHYKAKNTSGDFFLFIFSAEEILSHSGSFC